MTNTQRNPAVLTTPLTLDQMKAAIGEQLKKFGWTPLPRGTAIASKDYETAVGIKTAHVYLKDFGPKEASYMLQGDYQSESNNALEPHPFLLCKDAVGSAVATLAADFAARADRVIAQTYAARLLQKAPEIGQRVLFLDADSKPYISTWVADGRHEGGEPVYPYGRPESGGGARKWATLPKPADPRWLQTDPPLDTAVLTLHAMRPTGRLEVSIEMKRSQPLTRYPNHPPFAGIKGWMPLDEVADVACWLPEWEVSSKAVRRPRPR